MTTLKKNDSGNEVLILQKAFNYEKSDGIFDSSLENFVKTYQSNNNLTSDGIVGAKTWAKIFESAPTIRKGDKNRWVHVWQLVLGTTTADGIFGSNTKSATKTKQAALGLSADGVVGPLTWNAAINGVETTGAGTTNSKPVDYKQYDSRWAKVVYTQNNTYNKKQTIKSGGCGVTSAADVVATFWDKTITPVEMAKYSVDHGYRTKNSGTAWGFFKSIANKYGASKFVQTGSYSTAKSALSTGAIVVVSVGPSIFTKGGHYIVWWKSEDGYNYVNDPASASSSRAKNLEKHIKNAAKQFFCFWK